LFYDNISPPFDHQLQLTEVTDLNRGIFYYNNPTKFKEVTDGSSHTLLLGELQRLNEDQGGYGSKISQDGWAPAGVANLFDTDYLAASNSGGINNGMFEAPGSRHPGGAQFSMADGSATYISENIDTVVFYGLGTRAGKETAFRSP
jgi:prepilin-type processing-associated H-X9-DG protein